MGLHREHRNYLDRVASQATNVFDLTQIPKWLERNTSHPMDVDRHWNFREHEYQIDIMSDMSDEVVAQKCSQVGASELWVRLMLAMLSLSKSITIIYVLPTAGFARKFSKGRIDPIIEQSPTLRSALNRDVNSSELKQIGNNFLYIAGSYGQSAAISIPARALFKDEVDFCNQTTLTTFNSRLGHAKAGELYDRSFSTPTVEKYGINKLYQASSKAHYCVKCNHCHEWVAPNYMLDLEIPGFDGNLNLFEKEDLENPFIEINKAFIRCPECSLPISWDTIRDPRCRKWIHEEPDNPCHGYQILPIDVPEVNPLPKTLKQIAEYDRKKDWVNFKIGYPYSDAETSFLVESIDKYCTQKALNKPDDDDDRVLARNTAFGLDVGKISWFTIMVNIEGERRVIYYERIKQDGSNYLGIRVQHLIRVFGCVKGVVDAGPDISVSKFLVENNPEGRVWACYYARELKGALENYRLNEAEGIIHAARTPCFNAMAKLVNSGKLTLTRSPEFPVVKTHLSNVKRVDNRNDHGDMISTWVSTGDDHFAHSMNYCNIAMDMLVSGAGSVHVLPSMPMMRKKPMKTESDNKPDPDDPLGLRFAAK